MFFFLPETIFVVNVCELFVSFPSVVEKVSSDCSYLGYYGFKLALNSNTSSY